MGWYQIEFHKNIWDKVKAEADIYELVLPPNIEALPKGQELEWKGIEKGKDSWHSQRTAKILEVIEVYSNPKGTIKVIIAGKNKEVAIISRDGGPNGFPCLSISRYSDKTSDIFDRIKKGTFIVTQPRYYKDDSQEVSFISNESKITDIVTMLETLDRMDIKHVYDTDFKWQNEEQVKTEGTVSLNEVLFQEQIFLLALRRNKWVKKKGKWDLWNAVKAFLTIKKGREDYYVKAKALDGNTYELRCPLNAGERHLGYNVESLFKMEYWVPFVYRKQDDQFLKLPKAQQTESLMAEKFLCIFYKLQDSDFDLTFNRKTVKITRKVGQKGMKYSYLDGKLTKADDITKKLSDYFILHIPLVEEVPDEEKIIQRRVLSAEATKLIDEGLNGVMRDLEGEFPFHLNVLKKGTKWYLEIAGKEFYILGGYNELKRITSAIKGNAILDHSEDGYDARATKIIRKRLAVLVGDENALFIILQVKRMGAMMKAISP